MTDDAELLRCYAEEKSEEAFAELVRRRIGLVYSVAWRHTRDAQRAEDVTQAVFTALARKAGMLARRPVLVGWLYRSAQFAASDAVRVEVRRQARELEAHTMNENEREAPEPDWPTLRPVLDEGLNDLEERDRDAVLLRFFDGWSFAEIGAKLGLTENTARMRVERALGKLHAALARRGVKSTAAALGVALAGQAGVAAPAGLAGKICGGVLVAGGATLALKMACLGLATVVSLGVVLSVVAERNNQVLRQKIAAVEANGHQRELERLLAENRELVQLSVEVATLRRDDAELARLRDEVVRLNQRLSRLRAPTEPVDFEKELTAPRPVTIAGQIRKPMRVDLRTAGVITLGHLIEMQGGPTDMGDITQVRITRRQIGGGVKIEIVDLQKGGGAFVLRTDDIIYVPAKKS